MSIITTAYVSNSGLKLFVFATSADGTTTKTITAYSGTLAVEVNGSPVTMGPATWTDSTHQLPFVAFLFPTAVGPMDAVTYTLTAGAITTAAGSSPAVSSFTPVGNYVGGYEPGIGACTGFTPNRQMQVGMDMAHQHFDQVFGFPAARNNRLRMVYNASGFPATTVVWDAADQSLPDSWTPAGSIQYVLCSTSNGNGIDARTTPSMAGQYSIVFDDLNANDSTNHLQVWISGTAMNCVGSDGTGGPNQFSAKATVTHLSATIAFATSQTLPVGATLTFVGDSSNGTYTVNGGTGTSFTISPVYGGSTSSAFSTVLSNPYYSRKVSGNTVTVTYQLAYVPGTPNGYNFGLLLDMKSATGNFAAGGTISNFWVFFPGDEANDRSDPYAISAVCKRFLTAPNGNGPAFIRCMAQVAGAGVIANFQTPADLVPDNPFTWGNNYTTNIPLVAARFYNTNPDHDNVTGDGTYGWAASNKFYHPLLGNQTDSLGAYVDLAAATGYWGAGKLDCGRLIDIYDANSNDNSACVEFRSQSPHGLRSGDTVDFFTPAVHALGFVTVSIGSPSITFAFSQTLATGAPLTFNSDTSGTVYQVITGGTGTSFTITPNFGGTSSGSTTATNPLLGPLRIPITGETPGSLAGTATVRHGSGTVVFSQSQALHSAQGIVFDGTSDPTGQAYEILPAVLFGTVSVSNGSGSITFSQSQTLLTGQTMTFSTGGGTVYTLGTGGTGTTFTITPNFGGTTSGTATTTLTLTSNTFTIAPVFNGNNSASATATTTGWLNLYGLAPIAWVTGPTTFVVTSTSTVFNTANTGAHTKRVNSTSEITLDPTLPMVATKGNFGVNSYGFSASMAAQVGASLWVPVMPHMSDACLQAIADQIAQYMPANSQVVIEFGNEHWNIPGWPTGLFNCAFGQLLQYLPTSTTINQYYTTPTTKTSASILNFDGAYALAAAQRRMSSRPSSTPITKG